MSDLLAIGGFLVIALGVALVLGRAVLRAEQLRAAEGHDRAMRVYRDQLSEVDRDLARGTIGAAEAERLRLEISRRILDLDKSEAGRPAGGPAPRAMRFVALGVVAVAVLGSGAVYLALGAPGYRDLPLAERHARAEDTRRNRPRQAALEEEFAARAAPPQFEGRAELEPMVEQLREALVQRSEDVTGFRLLAQNELRLGNYRAAIEAQERVIDLAGDAVDLSEKAFLLDMMVIAAGGRVSPEAEALIERMLRRDPNEGVALYYTGRMYAQTGRPDMTFRVWRRLHEVSTADAPWMEEIRAALPDLARISGEPRYQLPPAPAAEAGRGPSDADIAAAEEMDPEARAEMIEGMVASLSARLGNEGGPPEDWAQLIRALGVLEREDEALAILTEARQVFAAEAEALAMINAVAEEAGLQTGGMPGTP